MKVTALGEFGLIADISGIVRRASPGLLVGIGDDAAVWAPSPTLEIATTDILIEGIHFSIDYISWFDLGWKSVAVNLSDIAAMGGIPRYLLISLGLPQSTEVAAVEEFYRGAAQLADQCGTAIVGGDTVRSPGPIVVSVAAVGAAGIRQGKPEVLRRNAARPGDVIAVTGFFGASAAGLRLLRSGDQLAQATETTLRAAHLRPTPRVPEAQVLLASGVEAAMDVSDGLVGDLGKMCMASGVAAVVDVEKVPISQAVRQSYPEQALDMAFNGGEDYELLFAAPLEAVTSALVRLSEAGLTNASTIGEIVAGTPGRVQLRNGDKVELAGGGYDAFRE